MNRRTCTRDGQRGAAAVEFAIVLPVLLLLVLGAIDWGYYFFVQEVVVNSAREGARVGSLYPAGSNDGAALSDAQATAQTYLNNAGLTNGTATINVDPTVTVTNPDGSSSTAVSVSVTYSPTGLTGFAADMVPASANGTAVMRR